MINGLKSEFLMDHSAELTPTTGQITFWIQDTVVARTTRAMCLRETIGTRKLPPIMYFPIEDLNKKLLAPSEKTTYCPLKGEAHYWHLKLNGGLIKNLIWYYPDPKKAVKSIHGYTACAPEVINMECD